ncbi:MAG: 3-keto-5-aminohexanoate cleavage protein [Moorellales bacterium]
MARHDVDFSRYRDVPTIFFRPYGHTILETASHPPWEVPDKIAIIAAPTGAFYTKQQNPYQPYTVEEIIREAIESVEAGACSVHVHVRDENGFPSGDRKKTEAVVRALRERFGFAVHIDGEALFGETFEEMMEPIVEDLYESAAINCHATFFGDTISYLPPQTCKATVEVLHACGKKPLLAVYNPGDVDNTYRWLIRPGIVQPPFCWLVLAGMPGNAPMWGPLSMAETILYTIRRIRDVCSQERSVVTICACGRASFYLVTLAILLGCHVRVGKEDTIYRLPHRDTVIVSNREIVEQTVAVARMLGREPMTAQEYRELTGMRPLP